MGAVGTSLGAQVVLRQACLIGQRFPCSHPLQVLLSEHIVRKKDILKDIQARSFQLIMDSGQVNDIQSAENLSLGKLPPSYKPPSICS